MNQVTINQVEQKHRERNETETIGENDKPIDELKKQLFCQLIVGK